MGSINSIPVISQVKSMVQAINGDNEAAKKTQEDFYRTGIIASQVNSLVHSLQGNNDEARRIQEDFAREMEVVADSTPVIGHIKAAVHAGMGDTKKAEEVAMDATKSTVIAGAAVAGLVCGPGAPVCGAALAVGASAAWDGTETVVAGENRGIFKQVELISNNEASVGDIFDVVAGQAMLAGGGALGANAFRGKGNVKIGMVSQLKGGIKSRRLCRRSAELSAFEPSMPRLKASLISGLPGSFSDMKVDDAFLQTPDQLVQTVYSVFLILGLIKFGHPSAKQYSDEICQHLYPDTMLDSCEVMLKEALANVGEIQMGNEKTVFEGSLQELSLEMDDMVSNNTLGQKLKSSLCSYFIARDDYSDCQMLLDKALHKLRTVLEALHGYTRVKRSICTSFKKVASVKATQSFKAKHVMPDAEFNQVWQQRGAHPNLRQRLESHTPDGPSKTDVGSNHQVNTIIRQADMDGIILENAVKVTDQNGNVRVTARGDALYMSGETVDIVNANYKGLAAPDSASFGRGQILFTLDDQGAINHLHGTSFASLPEVVAL